MLLGQRLVQSKLVTIEQVQMALQLQVVHGGRLGSCLLKRGFIEIDALSASLSRHTGAPAAKLKHFDGVDKETLELIPAHIALKHRAIPLARVTRGGKELLVALRDPHDVQAVDEIAFVAGARVHAFIAPELLIHRYLERYYNVRPEAEFPLINQQQRAPSKAGRRDAITLPPLPAPISVPSEPASDITLTEAATAAAAAVAAVMKNGSQRVHSSGLLPHPATWLKAPNGAPAPAPAPAPRAALPPTPPSITQAQKHNVPLAPAVEFVDFHIEEGTPWTEGQPPILLEEAVEEHVSAAPLPERLQIDAHHLPPEIASGPWEPAPLAAAIVQPQQEEVTPLLEVMILPAIAAPERPASSPRTPSARPASTFDVVVSGVPAPLSKAPAAFVSPMLRPPWEDHAEEPASNETLSTEDAIASIGRASTREHVGETLVRWMRGVFGVGLVFIVKDEIAFGWTGFADDVDRDVIESIMVPMNASSVLSAAHTKKAPFRGAPSETQSTAQTHFYKLLKTEPPAEVIVVPIIVKDRVVNLVYGHPDLGSTIAENTLEGLTKIAAAAADAFVALIKKRKSMF